jgi:hypothetical protein
MATMKQHLYSIGKATLALQKAQADQLEFVKAARDEGVTWKQIAMALNVTPQAAQQRFGPWV